MQIPLYFTHAEIVETVPLDITLRTFVMPATNARIVVETKATDVTAWQQPNHQVMPPVLEAGVIQFKDKTARIGQISRFHTAYGPPVDAAVSERDMRRAIEARLPALAGVPGQWRHCLVTYSEDGLPLLGAVPRVEGLHVFSGFTGPFALVPPVAQRYAAYLTEESGDSEDPGDSAIAQLLVSRFEAA